MRSSSWLAFSLLLGACAEASVRSADAGTMDGSAIPVDASPADVLSPASSSRLGPLPACTDATVRCPYAPREGAQPLLTASSFGDGARLVDVGADAVLIARSDGSFGVVLLPPPAFSMPEQLAFWPLDTGAWTPIKVRASTASVDAAVFVLACAAQDRACAVFRANRDRQTLSAFMPLLALPARFAARGLAIEEVAEASSPCVYGDGLLCLSYGWREEIASSESLQLNDVTIVGSQGLAVGDHGRWFKRHQDDSAPAVWAEQEPLADVSLSFAHVLDEMGIVIGGGKIQALLSQRLIADLPCAPPGQIEAAWLDYGSALLVMANGELIEHVSPSTGRRDPDCLLYRLPGGAILAHSEQPCGLSENEHILKAEALWGSNGCPVD